jgi:hypothetical protein
MERDLELIRMQEEVEASDELVAATAKRSTKTFHRAKKGQVPPPTRKAFVEAMESIRLGKIERLTKAKCKAVG